MKLISIGLSVAISFCVGISDAGGSPTRVDSLYAAAFAQIGRVPIASCIRSFEDVLRVDRDFAPAYYQIARLYMRQNTPRGRMRAEKMLRRAIRLDPKNREYQMGLGDLMWSQGYLSRARRQYEKVLAASPGHAEGAYKIGRYFLKEYIKYRDMTYFDGVTFEWRHFADDFFEKARMYFELAIKQDPKFREAHLNLGLIYFENGEPRRLIEVLKDLLEYFPDDKDSLLFLGLGYQTVGRNDLAFEFYDRALQRMDMQERILMESVSLIVPKNDENAAASRIDPKSESDPPGTSADSDARAGFWARQDPLFLTDFNERRLAHYGRIAYANLRFGQPRRGLAGYLTPMGKTHIKFGLPISRHVRRPSLVEQQVRLGGRRLNPHLETWYYEGFQIKFRNWDGRDGWRFYVDAPPPEPAYSHVFKTTAPRYIDPYLEEKYSIPFQMAAFQEQENVRVEVSYATPLSRLAISQSDGFRYFQDGIFVFDQDWTEVFKNVRSFSHTQSDSVREPTTASDPDQILGVHRVFLKPGAYHVAVEVRDPISGSIGTFRTPRTLTINDSVLAISDVLLAKHIVSEDPFPETWKDLKIVPNPRRTFARSEPVFVYLELYNLTQDVFGRTRFNISYQLTKPSDEEIAPTLFVALDLQPGKSRLEIEELTLEEKLRRKIDVDYRVKYVPAPRNQMSSWVSRNYSEGDESGIAITASIEGDRSDDFTHFQLDIDQLSIGIYKLTVIVEDKLAERTVKRHAIFRVLE